MFRLSIILIETHLFQPINYDTNILLRNTKESINKQEKNGPLGYKRGWEGIIPFHYKSFQIFHFLGTYIYYFFVTLKRIKKGTLIPSTPLKLTTS